MHGCKVWRQADALPKPCRHRLTSAEISDIEDVNEDEKPTTQPDG